MFLTRGFAFTHEAVRDWEGRFAPLMAAHLRAKRRGQGEVSWYADEACVKVQGQWCYLYRAIVRSVPSKGGNTRAEGLRPLWSLIT